MKTDLPPEIKRFKQIREENNFTQSEFAEILNIKNSTSDIKRQNQTLGPSYHDAIEGIRSKPTLVIRRKLPKEIRCSPHQLYAKNHFYG